MPLIELAATLFGLACVALFVRQNIWSWPTGLVQVVLFAWVFYQAKLYSDFVLHLIYIVLQIYGWIAWSRRPVGETSVPISRLTPGLAVIWTIVIAVGTLLVGFATHRYTEAALPWWDAGIAVASLVATYLLARKVLENWLIWIVVDVVAIGVYLTRELYITTALYAVFLAMATAGWFAWRRSIRQQPPHGSEVATASSSGSFSHPTADTSS